MFKTSGFEKLLDKATSNLLMEPDWPTILQICDLIRQDDVQPRTALNAIKKKLISQNPHTALYALQLLDSMFKNCGSTVHDEFITKQFCEMLHELTKTTPHENVRQKLLELIQGWSFAFRKSPKRATFKEIMTAMKLEGFKFPTLRFSDAMFTTNAAPELVDREFCHHCHIQLGMSLYRNQCSRETMSLPKFGIEKKVRVCDACVDKFTKPSTVKVASEEEYELPPNDATCFDQVTKASTVNGVGKVKSDLPPDDAIQKLEIETAQYELQAAKGTAEVIKLNVEAAQANVEAAKANAEAAKANAEAAKVNAEAAKTNAEAAKATAEYAVLRLQQFKSFINK